MIENIIFFAFVSVVLFALLLCDNEAKCHPSIIRGTITGFRSACADVCRGFAGIASLVWRY